MPNLLKEKKRGGRTGGDKEGVGHPMYPLQSWLAHRNRVHQGGEDEAIIPEDSSAYAQDHP